MANTLVPCLDSSPFIVALSHHDQIGPDSHQAPFLHTALVHHRTQLSMSMTLIMIITFKFVFRHRVGAHTILHHIRAQCHRTPSPCHQANPVHVLTQHHSPYHGNDPAHSHSHHDHSPDPFHKGDPVYVPNPFPYPGLDHDHSPDHDPSTVPTIFTAPISPSPCLYSCHRLCGAYLLLDHDHAFSPGSVHGTFRALRLYPFLIPRTSPSLHGDLPVTLAPLSEHVLM
eukprot:TRINITY_DN12373_c3_g1_i5.p1 TRINITY_DN12373_c3_g1~~TRINITY_DN12373_c3_g1_i5.p1  ORF type:complete len:227 (+),score=-6.24 TRINITY_DN12373_c3_g1_i5:228-908(+)